MLKRCIIYVEKSLVAGTHHILGMEFYRSSRMMCKIILYKNFKLSLFKLMRAY